MEVPAVAGTAQSPAGAPRARGTLKLRIPAKRHVGRRPRYVTSSVASLVVAVKTAGATTFSNPQTFPIQAGTSSSGVTCTAADNSGSFTCTVSVALPPGSDTIRISTYTQSGGSGALLSQAIVTESVVAGAANAFTDITLDANPGSITLTPATTANVSGNLADGFTVLQSILAPVPFTVATADAAGEPFAGQPGVPSLAFASLGASAAFANGMLTITPQSRGSSTVEFYLVPAHGEGSTSLAALTAAPLAGATSFSIAQVTGTFANGSRIVLGAGTAEAETLTVAGVTAGTTLLTTSASQYAHALGDAVADPGSDGLALAPQSVTVDDPTPTQIVLTSGNPWQVPSDWNSSANEIEVIGGGGSGGGGGMFSGGGGGGGGGGAYASVTNITSLEASSTVAVNVGGSGSGSHDDGTPGGPSFVCPTSASCTSATALIYAAGGGAGSGASSTNSNAGPGGSGGPATSDATSFAGGKGGAGGSGSGGGGGGGGAAGPLGAGAGGGAGGPGSGNNGGGGGGNGGGSNGAAGADGPSVGGNGGNNHMGLGGGAGGANSHGSPGTAGGGGGGSGSYDGGSGGGGGNGIEWLTVGSGGGGGGGGNGGGAGGLYGGGGGGGYGASFGTNGGGGLIVISYLPSPGVCARRAHRRTGSPHC